MRRKEDSSADYSIGESDRLAPGLSFGNLLLSHLNHCGSAYSNNQGNFVECVEALRKINIPRLNQDERNTIDTNIKK
jgi:hypothetical protein